MRIVVHEENGNSMIEEEFDQVSIGKQEEAVYYDNHIQTNAFTKGWTQQHKTLLEAGQTVAPPGCCSQDKCSIF